MGRHAFWGHPPGRVFEGLAPTKKGRVARLGLGLAELRETERRASCPGSSPKSVWQLFGNGSVGSQALTGIPVLARLRDDPALAPHSRVWPFEALRAGSPRRRAGRGPRGDMADYGRRRGGGVKDEAQVRNLASMLRERDRCRCSGRSLRGGRADGERRGLDPRGRVVPGR